MVLQAEPYLTKVLVTFMSRAIIQQVERHTLLNPAILDRSAIVSLCFHVYFVSYFDLRLIPHPR